MDVGTLIAASTEQVFVEAPGQEGASGSGWFDVEGNLVVAPMSFAWSFWNAYDPPNTFNEVGSYGVSGTSYRITKPMVSRMLNPNTPANGVNGQYLVPSLGIISTGPVDAYSLWYWYGPEYYPDTENVGISFVNLATQGYFDDTASCGQVPQYCGRRGGEDRCCC